MQKFTFNRQKTSLFSEQQNKLAYHQDELRSFIDLPFSKENLINQINKKKKSYSKLTREHLVNSLKRKYAQFELKAKEKQNLDLLKEENTFTITTGHQLSIFTGPIYLIYKIIHVIRMTEILSKENPQFNFVPVFWMASEDHDFEEISTFEVFGKEFTWKTDQKGAVGRFSVEGLKEIKEEVLAFFSNHSENEIESLFNEYDGENLGIANFRLIRKLFSDFGLIIVDGDDTELKELFIPVVEKELTEEFSYQEVMKTNLLIDEQGLKKQLNPRIINLFYLEDHFRQRIKREEGTFEIIERGETTLEALLDELHQYPKRFSPNVVLRPVYQESILPNLCYVGGTGEIAYWLQLKGVFDHLGLQFPLIQIRTSILWIDHVTSRKMDKANMTLENLFSGALSMKNQYLKENSSEDLHFENIDLQLESLKKVVIEKVLDTDPHLEKYAHAEIVRLEKQIDGIKDRLTKTVKQKHDTALKTIEQVFEKLFPNGGMQERSMNLLSLCSDGKIKSKISRIHDFIDPFDPDFVVIRE